VDEFRNSGENVGLIKVKTYRPFPLAAIRQAISKVKAVGVVDRSVSFGWNAGPVYQDILTAIYSQVEKIPVLSFIGGLSGADITVDHFKRVIETTGKALRGDVPLQPIWLNEED
jgi:pyruvate ferredoxin oxidoreductase alpha subunit/phenylglyoxylate dehydrogenase alpha subunit